MPRTEALAILEEGHRAISELLASLTDEDMDRPSTIGDGGWSAKDLAVHVALWEDLALRTIAESRRGERPGVIDITAGPEVDRVNAEERERHSGHRPSGARARFEGVYGELVLAIDELTEEQWNAPVVGATVSDQTLGDLVGSTLAGEEGPFCHADEHIDDLRDYVASLRTNS